MRSFIDKDNTIDILQNMKVAHPLDSDRYLINECISAIADIQSADARENSYGEWKFCPDLSVYCSECGHYPADDYAMTPFCPHCGLKMKNGDTKRW